MYLTRSMIDGVDHPEGIEQMDASLLVGIDGSIASRAAITWALARAQARRIDVALLMVVDDEWGTVGGSALRELHDSAEKIAARELEFALDAAATTAVRVGLASGNPMLTLSGESTEFGMVVIGTHKVGYFHGHALGSRSLQLAALAPVPVAVIPVATSRGRSGVVVGVGDAPGWADVVGFAATEASRMQEPLVLLRREHGDIDHGRMSEAERVANEAAPDARVELRRVDSTAGEALATASRRAVVTITGRPTILGDRMFRPLGRANSDLLMNLAGPAILVPQLVEAPIGGTR
jgi:nucleotide-binding universal stress UspA family protein